MVHQEMRKEFIEQELRSLMAKGAIQSVPLPERDAGLYRWYFLVLKKDVRPEPYSSDIQVQLTIKLVSQIQFKDWFEITSRYCQKTGSSLGLFSGVKHTNNFLSA